MQRSIVMIPGLLVTLAALFSSGCANLERNLNDPAVMARISEIGNKYQRNIHRYQRQQAQDAADAAERRRAAAQPRDAQVSGQWSFISGWTMGYGTSTPKTKVNVITQVPKGIYAKRRGASGQGQFYARVAPNTYRSQSGQVYRFQNARRATWQGGGKTIEMSRER